MKVPDVREVLLRELESRLATMDDRLGRALAERGRKQQRQLEELEADAHGLLSCLDALLRPTTKRTRPSVP